MERSVRRISSSSSPPRFGYASAPCDYNSINHRQPFGAHGLVLKKGSRQWRRTSSVIAVLVQQLQSHPCSGEGNRDDPTSRQRIHGVENQVGERLAQFAGSRETGGNVAELRFDRILILRQGLAISISACDL